MTASVLAFEKNWFLLMAIFMAMGERHKTRPKTGIEFKEKSA